MIWTISSSQSENQAGQIAVTVGKLRETAVVTNDGRFLIILENSLFSQYSWASVPLGTSIVVNN
jgi:hypothetical protein